MKANFTTTNPGDIEMTMELTMNLKEWKKLKNQLSEDWPSWDLGSKITSMVYQAEQSFYPKEGGTPDAKE